MLDIKFENLGDVEVNLAIDEEGDEEGDEVATGALVSKVHTSLRDHACLSLN